MTHCTSLNVRAFISVFNHKEISSGLCSIWILLSSPICSLIRVTVKLQQTAAIKSIIIWLLQLNLWLGNQKSVRHKFQCLQMSCFATCNNLVNVESGLFLSKFSFIIQKKHHLWFDSACLVLHLHLLLFLPVWFCYYITSTTILISISGKSKEKLDRGVNQSSIHSRTKQDTKSESLGR